MGSLTACSDQNAEEYNRDKVERDLSRLQSFEGVYTGELKRGGDEADANTNGGVKSAEETVGVLSVDFSAATVTVPAQGNLPATQRPILNGDLTLKKLGRDLRVPFTEGSFNPKNKQVQLSLSLTRTVNGVPQQDQVTLVGTFEGDTLKGVLSAPNYADLKTHFTLVRNGATPPSFQDTSPDVGADTVRYRGEGTVAYDRSQKFPVLLEMVQSSSGGAQDLFEFLSPYTAVSVNFTVYMPGRNPSTGHLDLFLTPGFAPTNWDRRQGSLVTTTTTTGSTQTYFRLECWTGDAAKGDQIPASWDCRLTSGNGAVFPDGVHLERSRE